MSLPSADRLLDAFNSFQTALTWPETQQRVKALFKRALQQDSQVSDIGELQLVQKEINGSNPIVAGNDEISTGVSRRLAREARYPLDTPAIAHFLGLGYWLILKVRVSGLDRARDSIDLFAAWVDTPLGP